MAPSMDALVTEMERKKEGREGGKERGKREGKGTKLSDLNSSTYFLSMSIFILF